MNVMETRNAIVFVACQNSKCTAGCAGPHGSCLYFGDDCAFATFSGLGCWRQAGRQFPSASHHREL